MRSRVDGEITEVMFEEGGDVKAGDALAIIDPRPFAAQLRQAEALRAKDEALLAGALLDLKRYEDLLQKNFASRQQAEQQRALVDQYRAQIATTKRRSITPEPSSDTQLSGLRSRAGWASVRSIRETSCMRRTPTRSS